MLWRLGGVPRALIARLERDRDRLEQLAVAADRALEASPLMQDPAAPLVAPLSLDRALGAALEPAAPAGDVVEPGERRRRRRAVAPSVARAPRASRAAPPAIAVERSARTHGATPPPSLAAARDWLRVRAERAGSAAVLDQPIEIAAATPVADAIAQTAVPAPRPAAIATREPDAPLPALSRLSDLVDELAAGGRIAETGFARRRADRARAPIADTSAPAPSAASRPAPPIAASRPAPPIAASRPAPPIAASRLPLASAPLPPIDGTVDRAALAAPSADAGPPIADAPSPLRRFALLAEAPAPPLPGVAPLVRPPSPPALDDAELADRLDRILRREARRDGLDLDP
jgi:hypothetical protein